MRQQVWQLSNVVACCSQRTWCILKSWDGARGFAHTARRMWAFVYTILHASAHGNMSVLFFLALLPPFTSSSSSSIECVSGFRRHFRDSWSRHLVIVSVRRNLVAPL